MCTDCNHTFSVISGTIFENTKISLRKWFMAMYFISSHKKGISSLQLSRDIHVTQKTAWFMLQKIRSLYSQSVPELSGEVECDETYIGGKEGSRINTDEYIGYHSLKDSEDYSHFSVNPQDEGVCQR